MSVIGKHNVRTYLEACEKYQKYENSCEIEELTRLMEGYAQLYHNNQKEANGATTGEKQCNLPVVSKSFKVVDIDFFTYTQITIVNKEENYVVCSMHTMDNVDLQRVRKQAQAMCDVLNVC